MFNQVVTRTSLPGATICAAFTLVVALFGCVDESTSALDGVETTEMNLLPPRWVACAQSNGFCAFDGTRQVRYGANNQYVQKQFTGGVTCSGRSFGVSKKAGASCDYDANSGVAGAAGMPGMGMAGAGSMAGMTGMQAAAGAAGSMAGMPMAGAAAMAMGPYIDMSAIPTGDPGKSTVDIAPTDEQPATSDGTGDFRTSCGFSHMSKDDPLVFPGKPGAAHLHAFFGNKNTDFSSTASSLRTSGNSTCRGGIANRSAYWVPALIDAAGKPVKPDNMDVYYKSGYNGIAPSAIKPFPSGLRVLAGDAKSSVGQEHAYWGCKGHYVGHLASMPDCGSDGLLMTIEFPQCWDGVNLDSTDHRSHMAYPSGGKCPSTHPVPIPAISFNVAYPVRNAAGWRLSSDMYDASLPGGMSAHADWMESWDPAVSNAFVTRCVNPGVDCHSHLLGDGRRIF
jgi:hypothetical protein